MMTGPDIGRVAVMVYDLVRRDMGTMRRVLIFGDREKTRMRNMKD